MSTLPATNLPETTVRRAGSHASTTTPRPRAGVIAFPGTESAARPVVADTLRTWALPLELATTTVIAGAVFVGATETALRLVGAIGFAALALVRAAAGPASAWRAFSRVGQVARDLLVASLAGALVAIALGAAWPGLFSSLLAAELCACAAVAGRLIALQLPAQGCRSAGPRVKSVLVAGSDGPSRLLRALEDEVDVAELIRLPADARAVAAAIRRHRPGVLLVESPLEDLPLGIMHLCSERGVRLLLLADPAHGLALSRPIVRLGGVPWVALRSLPIGRRHRLAKRIFDLAVVSLAAPFALPLMAIIALAVTLTSRGGILYRQLRLGRAGVPFVVFKFRTMRAGAEGATGPVLARPDDPRATPVGRFLRRSHLDELPQLWNVLRGEMSTVGPRPERPELVAEFGPIPDYDARHLLKPGITGLAQLVGGYSATPEDKLRSDLLYLASRSLWLDFRLIVATLFHVLGGRRYA